MSKFAIFKGTNGNFYFHLKADNGEIVLSSEGYLTKTSCQNGIDSVKDNSRYYSQYEKKTSSNGQYYFTLKASNGQVIGKSEMYVSSYSRDNGIEVVKREASLAQVYDQT